MFCSHVRLPAQVLFAGPSITAADGALFPTVLFMQNMLPKFFGCGRGRVGGDTWCVHPVNKITFLAFIGHKYYAINRSRVSTWSLFSIQ